jgi:hypothetical protein
MVAITVYLVADYWAFSVGRKLQTRYRRYIAPIAANQNRCLPARFNRQMSAASQLLFV